MGARSFVERYSGTPGLFSSPLVARPTFARSPHPSRTRVFYIYYRGGGSIAKKPFFVFHTKFKPFLSIIAATPEPNEDLRPKLRTDARARGWLLELKGKFLGRLAERMLYKRTLSTMRRCVCLQVIDVGVRKYKRKENLMRTY